MKQSAWSFLLVLLIEGICAVANYLKEKLMGHINRGNPYGFGSAPESEFA